MLAPGSRMSKISPGNVQLLQPKPVNIVLWQIRHQLLKTRSVSGEN